MTSQHLSLCHESQRNGMYSGMRLELSCKSSGGDRQSMTMLHQLHRQLHVHRALYDGMPEYVAALLLPHTCPFAALCRRVIILLDVPKVNLEYFGRHAFACAGPTLWNKLPRNMHDNGNLVQFKKQLKSDIFIFYITSLNNKQYILAI